MYTLIHTSLRKWTERRQRRYDAARRMLWSVEDNDTMIIAPTISITEQRRDDDELCHDVPESDGREKPSISFLYSLATRWAWNAVTYRCETHPSEADVSFRDDSGDTCLHWACFGVAPLYVVEKLLSTCPDLVRATNNMGQLPLHLACSYRASVEVIRTLLIAFPEGARMPSLSGSRCLHILCDYGCSVMSIQAVLELTEGASTVREVDSIYGRTPLFILHERKNLAQFCNSVNELRKIRREQRNMQEILNIWDGKHDNIGAGAEAYADAHDGHLVVTNDYETPSSATSASIVGQHHEQRAEFDRLESLASRYHDWDFWEKSRRLVLADYLDRPIQDVDVDTKKGGIVHACIGVVNRCPPSLLELALLLRPEELLQFDEQHRLPLHLACTVSENISVILDVLLACPQAACVTDGNGNLPWAIFWNRYRSKIGWCTIVEEFIIANPSSLLCRDIMDGNVQVKSYPHLLSRWSSVSNPTTRQRNVRVLYELLRGNPSILLAR